ncbi:hypothetical protein TNCV_4823201 [Trichonephila clavipes]|nr:hypothetical protein TNCV_4823201 [Trichonephila clavipes]
MENSWELSGRSNSNGDSKMAQYVAKCGLKIMFQETLIISRTEVIGRHHKPDDCQITLTAVLTRGMRTTQFVNKLCTASKIASRCTVYERLNEAELS